MALLEGPKVLVSLGIDELMIGCVFLLRNSITLLNRKQDWYYINEDHLFVSHFQFQLHQFIT